MKQILTKQQGLAVISGMIFGLGLGLSQMIDRQRVLGFLDFAGTWDPTLLFVLLSAVSVTVISFQFVLRRHKPVFTRA
ncbi:MAG: YeeE/YedE family protein, partial [Phormidesmis sp. RL_2_1]|nr:YeeE/YedE family protein [Phormidesmis sp. RL_2_1]